jgi:hypothetical protein
VLAVAVKQQFRPEILPRATGDRGRVSRRGVLGPRLPPMFWDSNGVPSCWQMFLASPPPEANGDP